MMTLRSVLVVAAVGAAGCGADDLEDGLGSTAQAVTGGGPRIVINEFTPGTSGKIELFNADTVAVPLAGWQVDDIAGGYAPKAIGNVTLAPGAYLTVTYAGINYASADEVRLLDSTGALVDGRDNFYTGSSTQGLCFGRVPDGGAWGASVIACSLGATNGCAQPVGSACNDSNACTVGETIQAGTCACGGGTAPSCDDGNASTTDACNALTGCTHQAIDCNDGNACTTDAADPIAGCTHATVNCSDGDASTTDSCAPATGCTHTPIDCNDANACTSDAADPIAGCTHAAVSCDDGNAATTDSCAPASGCVHAPISCNDGNACTTDTTDPVAGCAYAPVSCDDGNAQTTDSCDPASGCINTPVTPTTPNHAELIQMPRRDKVLLQGTVVLADGAFQGEVMIEGDTITCVAPSCAGIVQVMDAAIVRTNGLILPGLIDTHNHILFDIFDETHWSPIKAYNNHNQWTNEAKYKALVDAKQYLNGEGSPANFGCEMDKYGELKALIAGTTSVQGSANPGDKACYGSLTRTIDQSPNGLGYDRVQTASLFPTNSAANGVCANFGNGKTDAYVIHVGEGVDATARNELAKLATISTTPECLLAPKTTVIHGNSFGEPEMTTLASHGMNLVWSPRSNVFLYGAGWDMSKTTNIPLALSKGINVSIAPDWSIGGSQNMLDELRYADQVDNTMWGNQLTPQMLFQMATINAAKALGLQNVLGSLAVGKKADVFVIAGDPTDPYGSLLRATPRDVRLVMVGGVALYGDEAVMSLGPPAPGCEAWDICGGAKFTCVAQAGGTATNKLGQTYADIKTALDSGLAAYDAMDLSPYNFSPITPVVKCPAAAN